jgi:hypothetical protein
MNERDSNPGNLLSTLLDGMKNPKQDIAQLASLMYKKLFLDDERSNTLSTGDLELMKTTIMETIDFNQ